MLEKVLGDDQRLFRWGLKMSTRWSVIAYSPFNHVIFSAKN